MILPAIARYKSEKKNSIFPRYMVLSSLLTQEAWQSIRNAVSELTASTLCEEYTTQVIAVFLHGGMHVLWTCVYMWGHTGQCQGRPLPLTNIFVNLAGWCFETGL